MQRNFLEIARLERNSSESRKESVPPAHLFSPPMRRADHATTLPSERNRPAPIDTSEETLAAAIRNVSPAQEALSPKTRTRCENEQMIFNNSPQGSCSTRSLLARARSGESQLRQQWLRGRGCARCAARPVPAHRSGPGLRSDGSSAAGGQAGHSVQ